MNEATADRTPKTTRRRQARDPEADAEQRPLDERPSRPCRRRRRASPPGGGRSRRVLAFGLERDEPRRRARAMASPSRKKKKRMKSIRVRLPTSPSAPKSTSRLWDSRNWTAVWTPCDRPLLDLRRRRAACAAPATAWPCRSPECCSRSSTPLIWYRWRQLRKALARARPPAARRPSLRRRRGSRCRAPRRSSGPSRRARCVPRNAFLSRRLSGKSMKASRNAQKIGPEEGAEDAEEEVAPGSRRRRARRRGSRTGPVAGKGPPCAGC